MPKQRIDCINHENRSRRLFNPEERAQETLGDNLIRLSVGFGIFSW